MTATNKEIIRKINRGFEADDVEAMSLAWRMTSAVILRPLPPRLAGKSSVSKYTMKHLSARQRSPSSNEIAEGDYVAVEGRVKNTRKVKPALCSRRYFTTPNPGEP